jgi:catalase
VITTDPTGPHPNAIEQFLGTHPAALRFVQIPKPIPTSFARESFFAVSAFKFTNADGRSRYGRYRILPAAGNEYLAEAETAARQPNFLFDEVKERVADDATIRWPEDRPQLAFGEISLQQIAPNNAGEQQHIIFDPIPRLDGIEASADPLFEPRANIYLLSGRRRRATPTP